MLGIILIIFIGQKYYKLAKDFKQKYDWLYAIIGIATYYVGAILIGGVTLALIIEFLTSYSIDDFTDLQYSFMAIPFGIGSVVLVYYLLKKKWESEKVIPEDDIQDIGKSQDGL